MNRNFREMVNELKFYIAMCVFIVVGIIDLRNEMDLGNKGYEPVHARAARVLREKEFM